MRLLLDTHLFVWLLTDEQRISAPLLALLQLPEHELWVSAATFWELAIKFRAGKLPVAGPILHDPNSILARMGAELLPITASHAVLAGTLDWAHRDPFDRMLVAQATVEGLQLVSEDAAILAFPAAPLLKRPM